MQHLSHSSRRHQSISGKFCGCQDQVRFFALEMSATADATRERFGWTPTGPTLLEDIAAGAYAHVAR